MYLDINKLNELAIIANKAARSAGEFIASKKGSLRDLKSKIGGENIASCVVTETDIKAQEIIIDILKPTLSTYELGLLAEESTDDSTRFEKDYFWCIDPLDGTLSFSKDEDGYSTSIALIAKDGTPVIGSVFNPRTSTLYSAVKGCGATKNGDTLKVNSTNNKLTLLYDQSYLKHPQYNEQIEFLKLKAKKFNLEGLNIHHLGGAVMNGISTIEMAPAIYFKFPKNENGGGSLWDFAASSIIQSEAGGFNSNYFQKPLDLNRKDSTFMNHQGVIFCSSESILEFIPKID